MFDMEALVVFARTEGGHKRMVDLIHRYLGERLRRSEIDRSTARSYRYRLYHLAEFVQLSPEKVTKRHIERWLESSGRSASYKRGQLVAAAGFFDWCIERGHANTNPVRRVNKPRIARYAPRAFTRDQATAEVAACQDHRDRVIVLLGLQEGLRRKEIAELQVGDIDLNNNEVQVRGKGGRGRVTRAVPLTEQTKTAILLYLDEHPARSGPLVRNYRTGRAMTAEHIGRLVSKILYDANVKSGPYDGRSSHANRHTCAVDVLEESGDLPAVQQLLGHSSLGTTGVYVGARAARLRSAVEGRTY